MPPQSFTFRDVPKSDTLSAHTRQASSAGMRRGQKAESRHGFPDNKVMFMKALIPVLLLMLAIGSSSAHAQTEAPAQPAHSRLPTRDCIDTTQINEWHIVDDRNAIVRNGPKRYLVTLRTDCPQLHTGLSFGSSQANSANNRARICGDVGETVYSRTQPPCPIESVTKIDKPRFKELKERATRHASGSN